MFFHLDSGLNKAALEWLSWSMLIGVSLHLLLNVNAFKRYFTQTTGRWVVGTFALVLAEVVGTRTDGVKTRLKAQGLTATGR